jgi:hypothetical protein
MAPKDNIAAAMVHAEVMIAASRVGAAAVEVRGSCDRSREPPMSTERTVVGLFRTSGAADNARNRLKTEGYSEDRIALKVLKETAPARTAIPEELETMSLAPLFSIPGELQELYRSSIRNGETLLTVSGLSNNDVDDIARILQFFDPLRIDVIPNRASTA